MIKLTNYENGSSVYLDPREIISIVQCSPRQSEIGETIHEHGPRTRIDVRPNAVWLVREKADDVFAMIPR